ncbi:hypothetical protein BV20DRAFT_649932 [Pilatotrama ljubarskyi]|nr:hypothetical protein BV20DRAFT_649932 [Pilatotrama ljubarskyi]
MAMQSLGLQMALQPNSMLLGSLCGCTAASLDGEWTYKPAAASARADSVFWAAAALARAVLTACDTSLYDRRSSRTRRLAELNLQFIDATLSRRASHRALPRTARDSRTAGGGPDKREQHEQLPRPPHHMACQRSAERPAAAPCFRTLLSTHVHPVSVTCCDFMTVTCRLSSCSVRSQFVGLWAIYTVKASGHTPAATEPCRLLSPCSTVVTLRSPTLELQACRPRV